MVTEGSVRKFRGHAVGLWTVMFVQVEWREIRKEMSQYYPIIQNNVRSGRKGVVAGKPVRLPYYLHWPGIKNLTDKIHPE